MGTNFTLTQHYDQIVDEDFFIWGNPLTASRTWGLKAGVPLTIIAKLGNLTGCKLHICIPVMATDACVTSIATFFKTNTNVKLIYEFSNECWNGIFPQTVYCAAQGAAIWGSGDGARGQKWYGYRASAIMKIIRDVYNDPARWEGALATQMANAGVTDNVLAGVTTGVKTFCYPPIR